MTTKTLIITDNADTGKKEGYLFVITAPDAPDYEQDYGYADLVPAGTTAPLHITEGFVWPLASGGIHDIVIESPADSGKWKFPLVMTTDGNVAHWNHAPGVIMGPGDELCITSSSRTTDNASQASWALKYTIGA